MMEIDFLLTFTVPFEKSTDDAVMSNKSYQTVSDHNPSFKIAKRGKLMSFNTVSVRDKSIQWSIFTFEPHHEKTCFSHMRTTKVQISLHIRAV